MNDLPTDFSAAHAAAVFHDFSTASPLVHSLTNDVVPSFTANVLLALGASPAMVVDPGEVAQFAALANALLINVGTLESTRADAMLAAVHSANQAGKPWVLNPVAVGGLRFRTDFVRELLPCKPAVIRGNTSEIIALTGLASQGRGVDSLDVSITAIPAARELAARWSTVVAVTGEVDYVTDGVRLWAVNGGHPMMTRVVGTGCALSAVVTAFCARGEDRLSQVATACAVMARAGERAAAQASGPGSFTPAFLDALARLRQEAQTCA